MIYIYDREFNCMNVCDAYTSLIWRKKYYEVGNFEVYIPIGNDDYSWIKKDMLIRKEQDNTFGVIEYIKIQNDSNGVETITIKGNLVDIYLAKRIIWGTYNFNNKNIEEVINILFTSQVSNPSDAKRKIDNYLFKTNNTFTEKINMQVSYDNLLETIQDICSINEVGFRTAFNFEENKLYLELYKGLDKSITQENNDYIIFSKEFDNVLNQEYVLDIRNYKNTALVAGEGEGANRKLITVGDIAENGLDRNEIFIDARDLKQGDNTESEYINILTDRGKLKLSENSSVESFDSTININSNLVYKVDYDLGDKVSFVDNRFGIVVNKRIVEIEEVYENSMLKVNCVFGEGQVELLKKIRKGNV